MSDAVGMRFKARDFVGRHLFRCGDFCAKRQCFGKLSQIGGVAKRIPPLPPAPDLGKLTFGKPIDLLADGLDGWETIGDRTNLWTFKDGVLENGGCGGSDGSQRRRRRSRASLFRMQRRNTK